MSSEPSFFSSVFNFDETSKNEILNIIQYGILAIIFISLILKFDQTYAPSFEENKDTLAVTIEILIECTLLLVAFVFIHRIIVYIPTMSSTNYLPQNLITIVLPFLYVLLNQSVLSKKINLVLGRLFGKYEGFDTTTNKKDIKVSQPLAGGGFGTPGLLPQGLNTTQIPAHPQSSIPAADPDYNSMFSGGGNAPVGQPEFEPVAANSVLGSMY
jgi:hypothetical protein